MESILGKQAEVGMMTKMGGGTSAYFGALRGRGSDISAGGKSNGPVHFMELFETMTNVVSQSNVRRGSFAAYLPIEHPELFDDDLINRIREECIEAFKAESKIIEWSVNGYESEHLSSPIMHNFIKNRLNQSLEQIGIEPVFNDIDQELLAKTEWFDEDVLGNTATDFFFKRPTEYSKKDKSYDEDDLF